MSLKFFTAPGRFRRGNLHCHSTLSDGALPPEEVCRRYRAEGYDFIALTDHFLGMYDFPIVDTSPFRADGFTTLLGAELHSGAMENGELWHILAVGLPAGFEPPPAANSFDVEAGQISGPELAARAADAGAYVAIAHPQWSGMTLADARSIGAAHAIECYNHSSAVTADRADGFHMLDPLLGEGRRLNLIATDDAHFAALDHFGAWVMVKTEANSPEALLAGLKNGDFYSSQGPELRDIRISVDHIEVDSSAVETMIVQGRGSLVQSVCGDSMTRSRLPLEHLSTSPWVRVTVIDRAGQRAWSNPIWFEQISWQALGISE